MLIISKIKDYYDYLVGINGIDNKVVFDRRNYTDSNFVLDSKDIDKDYSCFIYKGKRLFVVEVGTVQYLFCGSLNKNELIKKFNIGKQLGDSLHRKQKYTFTCNKWNICTTNLYVLTNSILRSNKKLNEISINDILNHAYCHENGILLHNYAKFIPAQEAYDNIYNFLISIKNDVKDCEMTDIQKLLSKGFDKKTSFRKM